MIVARWTGAAGIDITYAGETLLVDPYPSRVSKLALLRPVRPTAAAAERYLASLPGAPAGLLITHTHFDHAVDAPAIATAVDAPVVGSASLATLLELHGLRGRSTVCSGGEDVSFGAAFSVRMALSRHGRVMLGRVPFPGEIDAAIRPPLRTRDYRHGTVFAPIIEVGGRRILHLGSAELDDAAVAAAVGPRPVDMAFVCVPGWRRAPDLLVRIVRAARPRVIVPFHFDDFTAPLDFDQTSRKLPLLDVPGFARAARAADPTVRVVVPRLYESLLVA